MKALDGDVLISDHFWDVICSRSIIIFPDSLSVLAHVPEMNTSGGRIDTWWVHGGERREEAETHPWPSTPQALNYISADTAEKRGEAPISLAVQPAGDAGSRPRRGEAGQSHITL